MSYASLIDAYLAGAEETVVAFRGVAATAWHERPVADSWSLLEILCHLADSEALFAQRIKQVLVEDRPPLPYADPARYAAALAYSQREAAEELALLVAVRRQIARILAVQPQSAWSRVGGHSTEGDRTVEQLVRKAIDHLEHHLKFVRVKRAMLASGSPHG